MACSPSSPTTSVRWLRNPAPVDRYWQMVYPTIVPLFTMVYSYLVGGLEHCFFFPSSGKNHPNWRTPSFFRGVQTINQLPFPKWCRILQPSTVWRYQKNTPWLDWWCPRNRHSGLRESISHNHPMKSHSILIYIICICICIYIQLYTP